MVGINNCEKNFNKAFKINSVSSLEIAKICEQKKITLVQISSHAVFDGKKKGSYSENNEICPKTIYSGTKYLSELC